MTVNETIRPDSARLYRSIDLAERLTERARFRIKVLDWHQAHSQNIFASRPSLRAGTVFGSQGLTEPGCWG